MSEGLLVTAGFKTVAADTDVQQRHLQSLQQGTVSEMQQTGKHFCGVIYIQDYKNPAVLQPGRNHAVLDTVNVGETNEFTLFAAVIQ